MGIHYTAHLGGDGGGFAVLVGPFGAADACPDESDRNSARRGVVAGSLMNLRNSSEASSQGAGLESIGESRQVGGDGFGACRKRDEAVGRTPVCEVALIGSVGAARVVEFGLACRDFGLACRVFGLACRVFVTFPPFYVPRAK